MNSRNFTLTTFIALSFVSRLAHATYDDPTCDSVCGMIVDTTTDQELNTSGTDGWTATDTAWCAANAPSTGPSPSPTVVNGVPTVTSASTNATTVANQNRCQYHNSQVLTYCLAYESGATADKFDVPLLALDITATAACALACANTITAPPLEATCRITSTAASAASILDELTQQNSAASKAIGVLLGGAGLAVDAMGIYGANGIGSASQYLAGQSIDQGGGGTNLNTLNACISMGTMAALSVQRGIALKNTAMSKQTACQDVKNLLRTDPVIGASSGTGGGGAYGGGTGGGGSSSSAGSSINGSGASSITPNLAAQTACAQNSMSGCAGQMSAATDGGLLNSSGLGPLAAQSLQSAVPSGLAQGIASGASPSSLIGSALDGQNVGELGDKLVDYAKTLEQLGLSAPFTGGASGASATKAAAPKGFDFGGATAAAANAPELKFDRSPASEGGTDIWHTGYNGSIFQIVSNKIVQSKDRVQSLDWSTPLNRALLGLPKAPKNSGESLK